MLLINNSYIRRIFEKRLKEKTLLLACAEGFMSRFLNIVDFEISALITHEREVIEARERNDVF